jgi:hypothetical protein
MSVVCDNPLNDNKDERIFDLFKRRFDAEIDRTKNLQKWMMQYGLVCVHRSQSDAQGGLTTNKESIL